MKILLKRNINPTQLKVGINSMKALRDGRLIIGSGRKEDIDILKKNIEDKCSQLLDINIPKLRNPNLIIYNIPEDITTENAAGIIVAQNPELNLKEESLMPKFIFKTKRNSRNLVMEVTPESWRILVQKKLKLCWQICNVEDYIKVRRCYKCSRYSHRAQECHGDETCPLCAGNHKLADCAAKANEYKCINCVTYNKHNREQVSESHSSLDKNCPCMISMIRKYKQNTEY